MDPLETLWATILSRDPQRIYEIWQTLDVEEQGAIYAHLTRMATEEGWTEPQRISAQTALDALRDIRTGS